MSEDLMKGLGFTVEGKRREKACCRGCGQPVNERDFCDDDSVTEFKISGLCQACQHELFTDLDVEEYGNPYSDKDNPYT